MYRACVDDSVNGLSRAGGMQRTEYEVSGLGCGHRKGDGLVIAHLADEDYVRILTQRAAERLVERRNVAPELSLMDSRLLLLVAVLYRVLDGDDVAGAGLVDVLHQRGEGRGLTSAGRAGNKHETSALLCEFQKHRRHFQLLKGGYLGVQQTDTRRELAALAEYVDALAGAVLQLEAEVDVLALGEHFLLLGGEYRKNGAVDYLVGKLGILAEFAVYAHNGGSADGKVYIGGVHFARLHYEFFKCHGVLFLPNICIMVC